MRAVLTATATVAALAVALSAPASGASSQTSARWASYLAPRGACPNSNTAHGSPATETQALTCLVNWTRHRVGLPALAWSPRLAAAADVKARTVVSCGDFSHYPCGTRWPSASSTFGRRWNVWGENLYFGNLWLRSPRAAVLAWLRSPEHRRILFSPLWASLGASVRENATLDGATAVSLWVLEVAGRN
ncbi:MAG TPA: CAP domain-containing protein [Gaiellaceae bacterium]|nr:CAP domain-containing protein [Gaiellaceae bacterium]